jgi:hypothetical protein
VAIFTVSRIEEAGVTPDNLTVGGFSMVSISYALYIVAVILIVTFLVAHLKRNKCGFFYKTCVFCTVVLRIAASLKNYLFE